MARFCTAAVVLLLLSVACAEIKVHIVCHTHDDPGWLKTFDEYHFGARQDIQVAATGVILDSVIQALAYDPARKFVYAEMSFFAKWWAEQDDDKCALVKRLVRNGQLDFVNGGWVQNDEAGSHYVSMIDQTTRGHRFLNATFGKVPRVGWQIDPFGHSATQASLMSGALGLDALFFGRADYQDMELRKARRSLELVWRGAASYGQCADVFTHNYFTGNYGPPDSFFYENGFSTDPPIVDDPDSPGYNVHERVQAFVDAAQLWANATRGENVLFMMGSDFNFMNANGWYKNLDRLIKYVNQDGRVSAAYSTPAAYIDAKAKEGLSFELKTDDFFPYSDNPHSFWTGYFSSRPASKGYIRQMQSYLQAARQLQVLSHLHTHSSSGGGRGSGSSSSRDVPASDALDVLEASVALTQHHDGITGTSRQAVVNDYHRMLHKGWMAAASAVNDALARLMFRSCAVKGVASASASDVGTGAAGIKQAGKVKAHRRAQLMERGQGQIRSQHHAMAAHGHNGFDSERGEMEARRVDHMASELPLFQCPLLNVSICQPSVNVTAQLVSALKDECDSAAGRTQAGNHQHRSWPPVARFMLTVYNPLAWRRLERIRLPVMDAGEGACGSVVFKVTEPDGAHIPSVVLPISAATRALQTAHTDAGVLDAADASAMGSHELAFAVQLPPLGYASFLVEARAVLDQKPLQKEEGEAVLAAAEKTDEGKGIRAAGARAHEAQAHASTASPFSSSSGSQLPGHVSILAGRATPQTCTQYSGDGSYEVCTIAVVAEDVPAHPGQGLSRVQQQQQQAQGEVQAGEQQEAYSIPHIRNILQVGNEHLQLDLDLGSGRLLRVTGLKEGWSTPASFEYLYYVSSSGEDEEQPGQSSGPYIFRPAQQQPTALPVNPVDIPIQLQVVVTSEVVEVRQGWGGGGLDGAVTPWAFLTLRLWKGADHLELEWTVGPIPIKDGVGREVVLRASADRIASAGVWWTDANGREMVMRRRSWRPTWDLKEYEPVAGNVYPITSAVLISDATLTLSLITERAQGAASLADGQLEVMVHRRNVVDDARGVAENLNETMCACRNCGCAGLMVRGTLHALLGRTRAASRALRTHMQLLNDPPLLVFGALPTPRASPEHSEPHLNYKSSHPTTYPPSPQLVDLVPGLMPTWSALSPQHVGAEERRAPHNQDRTSEQDHTTAVAARDAEGLPANVHLVTLAHLSPSKLLVRLAHTYQVGEDALATPVKVDLATLLTSKRFKIKSVRELSLSAAQYRDQMPERLSWRVDDPGPAHAAGKTSAQAADAHLTQLKSAGGQRSQAKGQGGGDAAPGLPDASSNKATHAAPSLQLQCPEGKVPATARPSDDACSAGNTCSVHPSVWQHTRHHQLTCVPAPKTVVPSVSLKESKPLLVPWAAASQMAARQGHARVRCHAAGGLSSVVGDVQGGQKKRQQAVVELQPMEVVTLEVELQLR